MDGNGQSYRIHAHFKNPTYVRILLNTNSARTRAIYNLSFGAVCVASELVVAKVYGHKGIQGWHHGIACKYVVSSKRKIHSADSVHVYFVDSLIEGEDILYNPWYEYFSDIEYGSIGGLILFAKRELAKANAPQSTKTLMTGPAEISLDRRKIGYTKGGIEWTWRFEDMDPW